MAGDPLSPRLRTTLFGLEFSNPVIAASGTFGYGVEMAPIVPLRKLGGFVVKGLSREPIRGNPPPRLWETQGGMINSVGLQNVGVRAFVRDKLPLLRGCGTRVIANVFGYEVEDYCEVIRVLEDAEGVDAYELNVSCPNTKHGGMFFSSDPRLLAEVAGAAAQAARRPVIVKLSPNVARIDEMARAAEESGAAAVSLVNTFLGLAIDARTRRPRLGAGYGGVSGPAIKPLALRLVREAARAVKIPVIGLGGILTGEDAAEFLIAGASAVEVGTATMADPTAPVRIAAELDEFLSEEGVERASSLVGTLEWPS
ncbi:MAG: dihydroorotate dehydrogenase B (NAD(+)), catalytic subunit [Bryobacteraceae bacterium]|nr:MAG: dihydroorotate dehydrogenase B (NAD(+)), catalytic subunit [Bryobacteraceae bacterium]